MGRSNQEETDIQNNLADLSEHTARLQELAELGFEAIYLHHVGQELEPFIDAFGEHVLPELR